MGVGGGGCLQWYHTLYFNHHMLSVSPSVFKTLDDVL